MFGFHRNRGHNNHMLPGYEGPRPATYSYAASRESYAASTEQVIQYSGPTSMELHKIPGVGDHPLLRSVFGPIHHDRSMKGDHRSSPPTDDHNKFHMDNSSPKRDHHYGKFKNSTYDESDDDEKDGICKDGVCYPKPKNMRDDQDYERERSKGYNHTSPNPIFHPKKDPYHETSYNPHGTFNEKPINPPSYTVPVSVQPKKNNYPSRYTGSKPSFQEDPYTVSTHPIKDNPHDNYPSRHTGSKPSFQQDPYNVSTHPKKDNPHDNYPSHHTGSKPSFQQDPYNVSTHPKKDNPHDNYPSRHTGSKPTFQEDPYSAPTHPIKDSPHDNYPSRHTGTKPSFQEDHNPHNSYASPPSHPKKDPYPRESYYEKPKGGSYSPPSYTKQPSKDHDAITRPMKYDNPLASIRTKPEHGNYHDGTSSPKSPFSPKDHREAIDSMEARRRYGKVSSPMGEKNKGDMMDQKVIDSQEAARKYNGIFVNY